MQAGGRQVQAGGVFPWSDRRGLRSSHCTPLYRGCIVGHVTRTRLAPDWLRDHSSIGHHGVHMGRHGEIGGDCFTSLNPMTTWGSISLKSQ